MRQLYIALLVLVAGLGVVGGQQNGGAGVKAACVDLFLQVDNFCFSQEEESRGKTSDLSLNGESIEANCSRNECSFTKCFSSPSEGQTATLLISSGQLFFDLTVGGQQVETVRNCVVQNTCSFCLGNTFVYKLTKESPVEFNLAPFTGFPDPTPSPTSIEEPSPTNKPTPSNEPTQTDRPTPPNLPVPSSSPLTQETDDTAAAIDTEQIIYSTGMALGFIALLMLIFMSVKKSRFSQRIKKTINSSTITSYFLLHLSQASSYNNKNKLHQVLLERFSCDSTTGWRPMSLTSDVSSISIKNYKLNLTDEDNTKAQSLRALHREPTQLAKLPKMFQKKKASVDWAEKSREVITNIHAKITSELDVENKTNNDPVILKGFQGEAIPFSLEAYLTRLVVGLNRWFSVDSDGDGEAAGTRCILFAVIYLRKIQSLDKMFKINAFNVHRLFAILMLVAAKMSEDELISNFFWAEVCGIPLEEINLLEHELCFESDIDFNVGSGTMSEICREFSVDLRLGLSLATEAPGSRRVSV